YGYCGHSDSHSFPTRRSSDLDKISLNSTAVRNPWLVSQFSEAFGSQFVVVAVDTKRVNGKNIVHLNGGRMPTEWETETWIREVRSEEHTSELQSRENLVCRLL